MLRVAFHTLGCKVNQIETEQIKEEFAKKGYKLVDFADLADVYVINTCTVTHVSDRKSRAMIRRAVRTNPTAIIAALGCSAQVNAPELATIKGVNLVVGNKDKHKIVDMIESYKANDHCQLYVDPITNEDKLPPIIFSSPHQRTRAFVKIQDGCQSFCSYCIVPMARGPLRSKALPDVLSEIKQLLILGYKEIVLTGIHTGFYGIDMENMNLVILLRQILEKFKDSNFRLRLSSIEPLEVSDSLIHLVKNENKLCNHFHIPLQSGSDKVLKDMNRRYQASYYEELLLKIKEAIPEVALAADVMVGFPTENIAEFNATVDLITRLPFTHLHIFKYSPRPGTKAASMAPVADAKMKSVRSEELLALAQQKHGQFMLNNLGLDKELLVEQRIDDYKYKGLTDNYLEVEFYAQNNIVGQFAPIHLEAIEPHNMVIKGVLLGN